MGRIAGAVVLSLMVSAPAWAGGELASIPAGSSMEAPPSMFDAQIRLKEMGYEPGRLDGYFGKHTAAALKAFQRTEELRATGALDAATMKRLEDLGRWFTSDDQLPPPIPADKSGKVDDDVRQDIIQLYSSAQVEDARGRIDAVDLLASMKNERAFAALRLVLLTNELPAVRMAAAKKLAANGDLESLGALAFALDYEKDGSVKAALQQEIELALPGTVIPPETTVITEELPLPFEE